MSDKIINLLTLSFAKGYRTFLCVGVILFLAGAHRWLGVDIPNDVWLGLFALLVACLRAGMPPSTLAVFAAVLFVAGCSTIPKQQVEHVRGEGMGAVLNPSMLAGGYFDFALTRATLYPGQSLDIENEQYGMISGTNILSRSHFIIYGGTNATDVTFQQTFPKR